MLSLPGAGQPNTEGPRAAASHRVSVKDPVHSSFPVTSGLNTRYWSDQGTDKPIAPWAFPRCDMVA